MLRLPVDEDRTHLPAQPPPLLSTQPGGVICCSQSMGVTARVQAVLGYTNACEASPLVSPSFQAPFFSVIAELVFVFWWMLFCI